MENKKEIGGFEIADGFVIGPAFFSAMGKKSTVLTCPPIWAFNYGVSNAINQLSKMEDSSDELQTAFNSLLDNLISEVPVYLKNRLRIIAIKDKLKFKMNSIPECVKAYKKIADIDINDFCDIIFLKQLDRVRGDKHHDHNRYDADYSISGINYDSIEKLRRLALKVKKEVNGLNQKLNKKYKDYDVQIKQEIGSASVEWTAVSHAIDLVEGGIIPKREITGLDKSHITYFACQVNYKKR